MRLTKTCSERVRFAVGDPDRADPKSVQDVETVELVLDRSGALEARNESELVRSLGRPDLFERTGADHELLMGDVREPHAEVVDDVVPLPASARRDRRRTAHERVEDAVQPRCGESLVACPLASLPAVLRHLRDVPWRHGDVIVQRDDDVLIEETKCAPFLGG